MTEQVAYRNPVKATGFTQVYHAITLDTRISAGAYRLLMLYEMHAQQKVLCWPGRARLAKMLCCSERNVTRYNNELEAAGYITRQRRMGTSSLTYIEDYEQIPHLQEIAKSELDNRGTSHVTNLARRTGQECHVKNEQGNNEQEEEKTNTPSGVVSPEEQQKDNELFFGGDVPEQKPQEPAQPVKLDFLTHTAEQAGRRDDPLWFIRPGTPCGDHDYLEPLQAFCAVIGRDPSTIGEHKTMLWLRQFDKMAHIGDGIIIQPDVMAAAIKAIRDDWNFKNKRWTRPYHEAFISLVEHTAAGIMSGDLVTESKGWSKAL